MKTLFVDCFSGLSGNMFLAAMIELGVDFEELKRELSKLHLEDEFDIVLSKKNKNGIVCNYLDVILKHEEHAHHDHNHDDEHEHHHEHHHEHGHGHHHEHHHEHEHEHYHEHHHHHVHRNLEDIHKIIEQSDLSLNVQTLAKRIFGFVARAESKVHGKPLHEVHFHEVGAIDSIVDIVGAAICIEKLGIGRVMATHVAIGSGMVYCAHGWMPVPAPATVEILKEAEIPSYSIDAKGELLTPTGAAILAALVSEYGVLPHAKILGIGYGAGKRDYFLPNVVRTYLLEEKAVEGNDRHILEIRFQVDDMTGEELGFFMELAMNHGARDVYYQPVFMKKNRPATEVVVLILPKELPGFTELIFKHTSTLGFRYLIMPRKEMERQNLESQFEGEPYQVKIAEWQDVQKISYEYEDIKRIALKQDKTLQEVLNDISFSVFESIQRNRNQQEERNV